MEKNTNEFSLYKKATIDISVFQHCEFCPFLEACDSETENNGVEMCYSVLNRRETYALMKQLSPQAFQIYILFNMENVSDHKDWFHNNRIQMTYEEISKRTLIPLCEVETYIEELVHYHLILEKPIMYLEDLDTLKECYEYYLNWKTFVGRSVS